MSKVFTDEESNDASVPGAKEGRVFIDAPLARSLLELGAGETVETVRPRGADEPTILPGLLTRRSGSGRS